GGLALEKFQGSDEIAASGKRRPWTRWHDHRQMNRTRQGRQRRFVSGDPIAGCRCERDSLRPPGVTLSNDRQFKYRRPFKFGKTDCQRDQFFTEVKRAVIFCPVVIIVELSCQLLGAPPGISVAVSRT